MTDYQTITTPPAPKTDKPWLIPTLVGVAALALGFSVGGALVQPEVITETKEVEVVLEVANPDCVEALDLADEGFSVVADIMEAITDRDPAAMAEGNRELNSLSTPYNMAKSSCRETG